MVYFVKKKMLITKDGCLYCCFTVWLVLFQLAEVFEAEIDGVMQSLGYCCGRKHVFHPQVLCCYGKQLCTIPRDAVYFTYQNRYVPLSKPVLFLRVMFLFQDAEIPCYMLVVRGRIKEQKCRNVYLKIEKI